MDNARRVASACSSASLSRARDGQFVYASSQSLLGRQEFATTAFAGVAFGGGARSLTLGDRESAGRLAGHKLELVLAFRAPRALGVAKRAAGVVAGGDRGETLLREAIDELERGDAKVDRVRALADLGAMVRRRNRRTERTRPAAEGARDCSPSGRRAARRLCGDRAARHGRSAAPRAAHRNSTRSPRASDGSPSSPATTSRTAKSHRRSSSPRGRSRGTLTSVFRKVALDSREQLAAALDTPASSP
jgi:hypothetical protein